MLIRSRYKIDSLFFYVKCINITINTMTITFTTTGSEHIYKINSNIVLRLYRNNHSVSILEFTDEMNNKSYFHISLNILR
jgi:hypothetical protein